MDGLSAVSQGRRRLGDVPVAQDEGGSHSLRREGLAVRCSHVDDCKPTANACQAPSRNECPQPAFTVVRSRTVSDASEMQRLLTYASYAKVGRALGVSRATVSEWAAGRDVNPKRLEQVRELMRSVVGRTKNPPRSFDWDGLMKTVDLIAGEVSAIRGRQDQVASEAVIKLLKVLAPPERLEVVSEMAAELEALLPPSDVAPHATRDTVDQDAAAPEARELG